MVPDVRLKKSPGHLRILFVICLFLAVFSDKHWTDIFGRGINPAGDSGDTSPQNVERGDGNTSCSPQIWHIYALVSAGQ